MQFSFINRGILKLFFKRFSLLLLLLFYFLSDSSAQLSFHEKNINPDEVALPAFKVSSRSYVCIVGIQRGKYTFLELGAEKHWTKVKLVNQKTYSLGANMEYNFGNNVLGYKISGWRKVGRINLTFGANLCYYTDFNRNRIGIGPAIGFRLLGFHLINGYNFTIGDSGFTQFNKLYISLRYNFPLDKKIRFRKSKK